MTDDNVNDHIIKNHIEMIVEILATDKEFYIFDPSYKDLVIKILVVP